MEYVILRAEIYILIKILCQKTQNYNISFQKVIQKLLLIEKKKKKKKISISN